MWWLLGLVGQVGLVDVGVEVAVVATVVVAVTVVGVVVGRVVVRVAVVVKPCLGYLLDVTFSF